MQHISVSTLKRYVAEWKLVQYVLIFLAGLSFFVAWVVHMGAIAYVALFIGVLFGILDIYLDTHTHCGATVDSHER